MESQRTAVMAHGLLGSVAIMIAVAERLAENAVGRDETQRLLLLKFNEQATHIGTALQALVRGLSHDAYH